MSASRSDFTSAELARMDALDNELSRITQNDARGTKLAGRALAIVQEQRGIAAAAILRLYSPRRVQ